LRESLSSLRIAATSHEQTRALGARLGMALATDRQDAGIVVGLTGELGAGKTTLVAGLLEALGHQGPVRSPTYALVEPYRCGGRDVYHCDLYRLEDPDQLEDLGYRDFIRPGAIVLVEWPQKGGEQLGSLDLMIEVNYQGAGRTLVFQARTPRGRQVMANF
jgi:tRNA threonylcarbamoyladenosine biosynthesis protein TsaE